MKRSFKWNLVVHYVIWIYHLLPFHIGCFEHQFWEQIQTSKSSEMEEAGNILRKGNQVFCCLRSYSYLLLHCKYFVITSSGDLIRYDDTKYLGTRGQGQALQYLVKNWPWHLFWNKTLRNTGSPFCFPPSKSLILSCSFYLSPGPSENICYSHLDSCSVSNVE